MDEWNTRNAKGEVIDMNVSVSYGLWKEVSDFFSHIVRPCKDCIRGNRVRCWESRCSVFRFRGIASRVEAVGLSMPNFESEPRHVAVEREIVERLRAIGKPIRPRDLRLATTISKVNKCHAIRRLIRRGVVKEIFTEGFQRMILLSSETTKGEQEK